MLRGRRRSEHDGDDLVAGQADAETYVELAREIQHQVARVASDEGASPDAFDELFAGISREERAKVARQVFDELPAADQWAVVERTFARDDINDVLNVERTALVDQLRRRSELLGAVRSENQLHVQALTADDLLTLGLFTEADVTAALRKGPASTTCARRLSLRVTDHPGQLQVLADVFNPEGGYFVTARYDERTWQDDRLPPHAVVRVGSIVTVDGEPSLEPVLHIGGRVDVEQDGVLREGRLHLGFALLAGQELFADPPP